MGRKLTPDEETQALRQLIREAHEATQGLYAAIKAASALEPGLVDRFQAAADSEFRQLSNYLQQEMNHQSVELNAAVGAARAEILRQLTAAEMVLDRESNTVRLLFKGGRFEDDTPIPYPNTTPKESTT